MRIFPFAAAALLGVAVACAAPTSSPTATMPAVTTETAKIPVSPSAAPSQSAAAPAFRIPGVLVTITDSRNGTLKALVTPGAACDASARFADGQTRELGPMSAAADGQVTWSYERSTTAGIGVHTVRCQAAGETVTEQNRFTVP